MRCSILVCLISISGFVAIGTTSAFAMTDAQRADWLAGYFQRAVYATPNSLYNSQNYTPLWQRAATSTADNEFLKRNFSWAEQNSVENTITRIVNSQWTKLGPAGYAGSYNDILPAYFYARGNPKNNYYVGASAIVGLYYGEHNPTYPLSLDSASTIIPLYPFTPAPIAVTGNPQQNTANQVNNSINQAQNSTGGNDNNTGSGSGTGGPGTGGPGTGGSNMMSLNEANLLANTNLSMFSANGSFSNPGQYGTLTMAMPTGSANYNGSWSGNFYLTSSGGLAYNTTGSASLAANFATNSISTTLTDTNNKLGSDLTGTGTISGNLFTVALTGASAGYSGTANGAFFGTGAKQVGGAFHASTTVGAGYTINGSFVGH